MKTKSLTIWHSHKYDLIFACLLLAAIGIYLSRIHFGIAAMDEIFYLNVPYRLLQGDSLIVDEWHIAQLSSLVIYPLLGIYLAIFKSTEGLLLSFRYIYLGIIIINAIFTYYFLQKRDKMLAIICSISFFLFTPYCIMALSYNTIGLIAVWQMTILSVTPLKNMTAKYISIGVLFAIAVLCNPYLFLLYGIYALTVFFFASRGKEHSLFCISSLIRITIGGAVIAFILIGFLLSRATITEILTNLPYVVSDSTHEAKSLLDFARPILSFAYHYGPYTVSFSICFLLAWNKKRTRLMFFFMTVISLLTILFLLTVPLGRNAIMLPLTPLGGVAFLFTKDKKWDLFLNVWCVAVFYALCLNATSNNGMYVVADACAISSCISLFFIKDYLSENLDSRSKRYALLTGIILIQLFAEGFIATTSFFSEGNISSLNARIEQGPLKGIYTTSEKKASYDINYENVTQLNVSEGDYILYFLQYLSGYFITDQARFSAFSIIDTVNTLEDQLMIDYYELHPDRVPDVIYVDPSTAERWTYEKWQSWCEENDYTLYAFESGGYALYRND